MKRGPRSPADNALILQRVNEVNRTVRFQPRHPLDGQLVRQRCMACGCMNAVADWVAGLNRLDLTCLNCGRSA